MDLIIISTPQPFAGEAAIITDILDSGLAAKVHLRRPDADEYEMRRLIESISPDVYDRLSLHSCFDLAAEYGIGGIHLNSRCSVSPVGFSGTVSSSCHTIDEVERSGEYSYVFFSPVFDSISKPGYRTSFSQQQLCQAAAYGRVIALGGVTSGRLPYLNDIGFAGAALLGSFWNNITDKYSYATVYNTLQQSLRLCRRG